MEMEMLITLKEEALTQVIFLVCLWVGKVAEEVVKMILVTFLVVVEDNLIFKLISNFIDMYICNKFKSFNINIYKFHVLVFYFFHAL